MAGLDFPLGGRDAPGPLAIPPSSYDDSLQHDGSSSHTNYLAIFIPIAVIGPPLLVMSYYFAKWGMCSCCCCRTVDTTSSAIELARVNHEEVLRDNEAMLHIRPSILNLRRELTSMITLIRPHPDGGQDAYRDLLGQFEDILERARLAEPREGPPPSAPATVTSSSSTPEAGQQQRRPQRRGSSDSQRGTRDEGASTSGRQVSIQMPRLPRSVSPSLSPRSRRQILNDVGGVREQIAQQRGQFHGRLYPSGSQSRAQLATIGVLAEALPNAPSVSTSVASAAAPFTLSVNSAQSSPSPRSTGSSITLPRREQQQQERHSGPITEVQLPSTLTRGRSRTLRGNR